MNLEGVNSSIENAKNKVKEASNEAAADLKKAREDGEASIDKAKEDADQKIDDSKMPDSVKKAAKNATSSAHKAATDAVEKAKAAAKDAVEEAEKKAQEAIDEAEQKAEEAIAKANDKVKEVIATTKGDLQDAVNDSKLPGPLKDLINKGLDELEKLGGKELDKLAKDANQLVDDLKGHASDMVDHLKDKALEVLGFEAAPPIEDVPAKLPTPKPAANPNTSRVFDHQGAFRFRVELGGVAAGAFTAVDGLSAQIEPIEYQGGKDQYVRQIPGRPKVAPVVLKKGYVNTAALWDWMQATMDGELRFENVSLVLLADDGLTELVRYNLTETWPSRWNGFQLDANSSNAMIEELELQARTVARVAG
jgi:phage tail-like protein